MHMIWFLLGIVVGLSLAVLVGYLWVELSWCKGQKTGHYQATDNPDYDCLLAVDDVEMRKYYD